MATSPIIQLWRSRYGACPAFYLDISQYSGEGSVQIISQHPAHQNLLVVNEEWRPLKISMTFNQEVESVDCSVREDGFRIVKYFKSKDKNSYLQRETVYRLENEADVTINGNTVTIDVSDANFVYRDIELENLRYYICMGPSVIKFKEGNQTVRISDRQWWFGVVEPVLGKDQWSFHNPLCNISELNPQVYDALLKRVKNTEGKRIRDFANNPSFGICEGMSSTVSMAHYGELNIHRIDPGAKYLFDIEREKAKSINIFYNLLQFEDSYIKKIVDLIFTLDAAILDECENLARSNQFFLLSIAGHTVMGFGHETGEWTKNGKNYNSRILIYDSAVSEGGIEGENSHLYYNRGTSEWCIPNWPNTMLKWIVKVDEIKRFDYFELLDGTSAYQAVEDDTLNCAMLESFSAHDYEIVLNEELVHIDEWTKDTKRGLLTYFNSEAQSNVNDAQDMFLILSEAGSDYTVIPDSNNTTFAMNYCKRQI